MKAKPEISIIIVNYNGGELLLRCLKSLFTHISNSFEVIVYDNASSDHSIEMIQLEFSRATNLTVINGEENLGFAKANNLAAKQANGDVLHFLNPDIIADKSLNDCYQRIIAKGKEKVYVTELVGTDGEPQKSKHIIPLLGNYLKRLIGLSKVRYWYLGASVIMNKEIFDKLGGWPEDYFMYAEDLDLFFNIHSHKIPVKVLESSIIHVGKGTTDSEWNDQERQNRIETSIKKFYRKYGRLWQYYLIRFLMIPYKMLTGKKDSSLVYNAFKQVNFK